MRVGDFQIEFKYIKWLEKRRKKKTQVTQSMHARPVLTGFPLALLSFMVMFKAKNNAAQAFVDSLTLANVYSCNDNSSM